ncbi:MAG: lipopolysaccharide biosynthesis protein [Coriobacteriia bacterium]|nr:lipopolysaccharide biosynthesis protein [Coriobacteriia bacterium]
MARASAEVAQPQSFSPEEYQRIRKAAYRWNTSAGVLHAGQSVFMLFVITRVCDVYTAGVFTIAFAVANLAMNIGWYGMRKFQVSDRQEVFSFREYRMSRIATTAAMIAFSIAYIAYTSITLGYPDDKTFIIFMMCLFKCVDSFEDLYSGGYQREDRLDVGARMVTIRQIVTIPVFALALIVSTDLGIALIATTAFTALFFVGQVRFVRSRYGLPSLRGTADWSKVWRLLKECFPLFAAAFLLFYIGNAPRYAIDAIMDDTVQAYFGYVSMPVFVVTMLASFVYNPMITELTDQWHEGERYGFLLRFGKVSIIVVGITAVCVLGAWLIGIPVLNVLYNTDVAPYLPELLILVSGGGFLALITLATVGITIIRFQRILVPLFLLLTVFAYACSNWAVAAGGITGAAWAYFGIMGVGTLVFTAAFLFGSRIKQ